MRRIWHDKTDELLVVLRFKYLAAAIITIRADVVTQMHLACCRLDCCRWRREKIVGAVHAAFGWGLLVLLNSHDDSCFKDRKF